jgi:hypothetical protein
LPHFRFHILSHETSIFDSDGVDLDGLCAAHELAVKIIYETIEYIGEQPDRRGWVVRITDRGGAHLLTVLYPASTGNRAGKVMGRIAAMGMPGVNTLRKNRGNEVTNPRPR